MEDTEERYRRNQFPADEHLKPSVADDITAVHAYCFGVNTNLVIFIVIVLGVIKP